MDKKQRLLSRLDEIGRALAAQPPALALIGLGSVGRELERLDEHSDLDFFVIVEAGAKVDYIKDLKWLEVVHPIAYAFQNTVNGYKLLFADEIFCEMAVFEPDELRTVPFAPGRIVWRRAAFDPKLAIPASSGAPDQKRDLTWSLGEALTNLYVGLERDARGEKLSATRFIQDYAVNRVLELAAWIETEAPAARDPFVLERRIEQRFPRIAQQLPQFLQGYAHNRRSALAILNFLEQHFEVNPAIAQAIRRLAT